MIWGLSLHGWEEMMRWSLAAAGVFALIVGVSTYFVVTLQREELKASKQDFEKYKVDAAADRDSKIGAAREEAKGAVEKAVADANAKIEEARTETAKALAETAKAQQATEEIRKENLELERAIAPRNLEIIAPIEALMPFARTKVMVGAVGDIEAQRLANTLRDIFKAAGWQVSPEPPPGLVHDGVEVGFIFGDVSDTPENKTRGLDSRGRQAAKALVAQLKKQHVEARELGLSIIGGASEWPGMPDDTIAVRVGLRPSTYFLLKKYPEVKKAIEDAEQRSRDLNGKFKRREEQ